LILIYCRELPITRYCPSAGVTRITVLMDALFDAVPTQLYRSDYGSCEPTRERSEALLRVKPTGPSTHSRHDDPPASCATTPAFLALRASPFAASHPAFLPTRHHVGTKRPELLFAYRGRAAQGGPRACGTFHDDIYVADGRAVRGEEAGHFGVVRAMNTTDSSGFHSG